MSGQGRGCMTASSPNWCEKFPPPWARGPYPPAPTIGGQCDTDEPALPGVCGEDARFAACKIAPGVGGVCYNATGDVLCLTAMQLVESTSRDLCDAYTSKCTIIGTAHVDEVLKI